MSTGVNKEALPAEFALACACCAAPLTPPRLEHVRASAGKVRDWELFDAVVRRNRISLAVHNALHEAGVGPPRWLEERLQQRSQELERRELRMARETVRLQRAFDDEGISVLVLKGAPVAMLAYGRLCLKESWDIDLLVEPDQLVPARRLLETLGYDSELNEDQFVRFMQSAIEALFVNRRSGFAVELHCRAVPNRRVLRGVTARGPTQHVPMANASLRTLADEPLFAFLCLHGASHNWDRLKWLADVHAFVAQRTEEQVVALVLAAKHYGALRSVSVALRLCQDLFGFQVTPRLARQLEDGLIVRMLVANAKASLTRGGGAIEGREYSLAWLRAKLAPFVLERGPEHFLEQVNALWNSPRDRGAIRLPEGLGFLYHLLRVPLWLQRMARRLVGKPTTSDLHVS